MAEILYWTEIIQISDGRSTDQRINPDQSGKFSLTKKSITVAVVSLKNTGGRQN